MHSIIRLVAAAIAALAVSTPAFAQSVTVVGSGNQYGHFDLSTREYTQIAASISGVTQVTAIAYDGTDRFIIDRSGGGARLKTLTDTGAASASRGTILANGNLDEFIGLSFGNGTLYSVARGNERLTTIDRTNAATTQPGVVNYSTGNTISGKLAFLGSTLYGTIDTGNPPGPSYGLYDFDLSTGAGTLLGNGGSASTYTNLIAFSHSGTLYGINGTTLYSIETSDGTLTNLGAITGTNLPSQFVAAVVSPVPEPSSMLLITACVVGVGRMLRRRRESVLGVTPPSAT